MKNDDDIMHMVLAETLFAPPPRPPADTMLSKSEAPDSNDQPSDDGET